MKCCDCPPQKFFLFAMRIFFGFWLFYVGMVKWVMFGPEGFIGHITGEFDKTWSPHFLNVATSWIILIAEPVLGLLILAGWKQRLVWTLTSLLMFMLTFGQTILMKPEVIANWQYLVLTVVCAAFAMPDDETCCNTADGKCV